MALIIPNDWDGLSYQNVILTVPDSAQWRGVIKGKILDLTDSWRWDKATGDQDEATETSWKILESFEEGGSMLQWIIYQSEPQTVAGGGNDVIYELDTVEYDPLEQFDLVNYKWVVPQDSLYIIGAFVQFWSYSSNSDNWARVRTKLNGEYHLTSGNFFASDLDFVHAQFELPCYLTEGDEVQFFVAHSESSSRDTADYNRTQRAWCYKL